MPTILSYADGDEYYGGQAKAFLVRNPENTVAYFKDFVGQEYGLTPPDLGFPDCSTRAPWLTRTAGSRRSTPHTATPRRTPRTRAV